MPLNLHGNLYRPVINAGQPLTQDIAGRFFYYVNGAGPILVKLDKMPASLLRPGQGIGPFEDGQQFDRIEISNPAGVRMEISFWAGFAPFVDNRQDQVEAVTEFVPLADSGGYLGNAAGGELAANSHVDLPGTPTETRYRRKAVQIANLDPAVALLLCDSANRVGMVVKGGDCVTFPVAGFLRVKNPTGAAVACAVSEIWWTL